MIYSIYGFGKGKTETAIGMCIRALGNDEKVLYVQFMKNGNSGEISILEDLGVGVLASGNKSLSFFNSKEIETERQLLNLVRQKQRLRKILKYELIILDEILVCVDMGMITFEELRDFVENIGCDVCMTGRIRSHDLRKKIANISDICSNNFSVKHNYNTYCEDCNQEYKYHYKHCPQCGKVLKISTPAKKGRDF